MRKLLLVCAATCGLAACADAPTRVAQNTSGSVSDVNTIGTNMAAPMNPWDVSTWKFHTGPAPWAPTGDGS
jgi:hypothetical protein